jgi:hypothetical protein
MPGKRHPPWFDHRTDIWRNVNLWSSSLCSRLHSPATSSLLGQDILLRIMFTTPSISVLALMWETKFHTRTEQHIKLWFKVVEGKTKDSEPNDSKGKGVAVL